MIWRLGSLFVKIGELGAFPHDLRIALLHPKALTAFRTKKGSVYFPNLKAYNTILAEDLEKLEIKMQSLKVASRSFGLTTFPEESQMAKVGTKKGKKAEASNVAQ